MPELYIITGANGAGKSSVGSSYLPEHIRNEYVVFDGDKLFMQKQKELWLNGMRAHKEAKKIAFAHVIETFETLVDSALERNDNFVYEGHFTNDETWKVPMRFKKCGYTINLLFMGLKNTDLSEKRVIERASSGGHFVPVNTIADNFYGNLEKLDKYHKLIDNLSIIDTSETSHTLLASFYNNILAASVSYTELPAWFTKYLPRLADKIKP